MLHEVRVYCQQLHSKCEMAIEHYSLLDMAKRMYHEHLVQGSTTEHPNIPGPTVSHPHSKT